MNSTLAGFFATALSAVAASAVLASGASAQSSVVPLLNEPPPRLVVDAPLPGPLADGVVYIPYRVENLRILAVGGAAANDVSPRVGHLHVSVNDSAWQWADYGQSNTIILVGMPRGEHKVLIEVVNPQGAVYTSQAVTFTTPGPRARSR